MIQDIEVTIKNVDYTFQRLPLMKALALQAKLLKMVGGGIKSLSLEQDMGELIGGVLANLDDERVPFIMRDAIRQSVVFPRAAGKDGTEKTFDEYYEDKLSEFHLAFFEVIKINFGGLVDDIKKKLSPKEAVTEKPSKQVFQVSKG